MPSATMVFRESWSTAEAVGRKNGNLALIVLKKSATAPQAAASPPLQLICLSKTKGLDVPATHLLCGVEVLTKFSPQPAQVRCSGVLDCPPIADNGVARVDVSRGWLRVNHSAVISVMIVVGIRSQRLGRSTTGGWSKVKRSIYFGIIALESFERALLIPGKVTLGGRC